MFDKESPADQELLHPVLVHIDVLHAQAVEEVGAVLPVVVEEHMSDHVTQIEDRAVDVEHDEQPVVGRAPADPGVVLGEATHPVARVDRFDRFAGRSADRGGLTLLHTIDGNDRG